MCVHVCVFQHLLFNLLNVTEENKMKKTSVNNVLFYVPPSHEPLFHHVDLIGHDRNMGLVSEYSRCGNGYVFVGRHFILSWQTIVVIFEGGRF